VAKQIDDGVAASEVKLDFRAHVLKEKLVDFAKDSFDPLMQKKRLGGEGLGQVWLASCVGC
jgi:hypothetical protein